MDAVRFAQSVLDMADELTWLRSEVRRLSEYEEKYHQSVRDSIHHSQVMMGGILKIALTPGVMNAIDDAVTQERVL